MSDLHSNSTWSPLLERLHRKIRALFGVFRPFAERVHRVLSDRVAAMQQTFPPALAYALALRFRHGWRYASDRALPQAPGNQ
ncbi:hypothetical protein OKW43_008214 [Paraburkholderia sp. WC7.3g]|uniref:hypothetical protein n=1 Tax=Paraburkholderia sp. WC7.3g TaxID=2991070 RepID=UPI003D1F8917